ncbi:tetratricopeptide repeat protein 17 isoform X1 [Schistocerca piceifrons]|uniref:tetratricopeptide repeat protein 17 isoform X1 n=1 Tax=Schistocerca piceifrons TaxID=274613 RepID=UPI001F5E7EFB|nr:tetratricopeptide repeat protein 17 isoform X1 [Schistocerca piceifrons]
MVEVGLKLLVVIYSVFTRCFAVTHWVVTENGRIQAQLDSAFHLRRPYDLFALLEQESRVRAIDHLHHDLISRKAAIDRHWASLEGATDIETRFYSEDSDCIRAGRRLTDTDLYDSALGDLKERIRLEKFLPSSLIQDNYFKKPDCTKAARLDFSMRTFEHLKAMVERRNLSMSPELLVLQDLVVNGDINSFVHQISSSLQKNRTSWLHYNLAAAYWRAEGNAPKAIECARRAVHFSPRQYRDLALLTLGGTLHRSSHPAEAAIVMHAAVDHAPDKAWSHMALGNVYAVLGDYNRSATCFDNALKLRPSLKKALIYKHAVLCHYKLEKTLLQLHGSLQDIVAELHEYHNRQKQWLKYQEDAVWHQAPLELRLATADRQLLSSSKNRAPGRACLQKIVDGHAVLSCEVNAESQLIAQSVTLSLQMLLKNVELQVKLISKQMSANSPKTSWQESDAVSLLKDSPPLRVVETQKKKSKKTHSPSSTVPEIFEEQKRLRDKDCVAAAGHRIPISLPPVYLSPETKGFKPSKYLNSLIGLAPGREHSLPWYPPLCTISSVALTNDDGLYAPEIELKDELMKYVDRHNSIDAEVGQRIVTAIKEEVGPSWLLHVLAALYWRIKGNGRHALDCLTIALAASPHRVRDVSLVSQAAVLHQMGRAAEALHAASEALTVNSSEPTSNFMMAVILESKKNFTGAIYHLQQVLVHGPNSYLRGAATKFLHQTSCRFKFRSKDSSATASSTENRAAS